MGRGDTQLLSLAERALQTVVLQALSLFRSNLSTFVPDIFAMETPEHQQEITTWWSNPQNQVPVVIGYSLQPTQAPQVAITTEQSQEIPNRRFVGSLMDQTGGNFDYTTTFEDTYALHVFGPNQNWLLWTQAIVRWALLINRLTLESDYGLINQRISTSPLRPVPDSLKDTVFPYMRTVFLSCQHEDTWSPLPAQTVESATVNVVPTVYGG